MFVAKVRCGRRLVHLPGSIGPDPRKCARYVTATYKCVFGDAWPAALRRRKLNGWRVRYSEEWRAWHASLWIKGRRTEVLAADGDGRITPSELPALFPTREAAKAGLIRYARALLGETWREQLWRT